MIWQKRGFAVQAATADCANKMTKQGGRHWRLKENGHLHGVKFAAIESSHSSLRGDLADFFCGHQIARCTRFAVPVIALHGALLARNDGTADAVAGRWIATDKAQAVSVYKL